MQDARQPEDGRHHAYARQKLLVNSKKNNGLKINGSSISTVNLDFQFTSEWKILGKGKSFTNQKRLEFRTGCMYTYRRYHNTW